MCFVLAELQLILNAVNSWMLKSYWEVPCSVWLLEIFQPSAVIHLPVGVNICHGGISNTAVCSTAVILLLCLVYFLCWATLGLLSVEGKPWSMAVTAAARSIQWTVWHCQVGCV